MQGVGKALDNGLADVGSAAVREIVIHANRLSVEPDDLAYIFWALATGSGLPSLGRNEQKALDLMVVIMERSGTMPNYASAFKVPSGLAADSAVDDMTGYMSQWAQQTMYPLLLRAYQAALKSQVRKVVKATNGRVKKGDEFDFLRKSFRLILSMRSSRFRDGELLRRVVRILPI